MCVGIGSDQLVIRIGIAEDETLKRYVEMALFFCAGRPHKPRK